MPKDWGNHEPGRPSGSSDESNEPPPVPWPEDDTEVPPTDDATRGLTGDDQWPHPNQDFSRGSQRTTPGTGVAPPHDPGDDDARTLRYSPDMLPEALTGTDPFSGVDSGSSQYTQAADPTSLAGRPNRQPASLQQTPPPTPPPSEAKTPDSGDFQTGIGGEAIQPGQVLFGRYRVDSMLGEGGMGSVWLVRHLELDTLRALKLIISGIAFDPRARARFKREARLMARLRHPNTVTVHDARMASDAAFIEMEYITGGSLSSRLKKGQPVALEWIAHILEQLCDVVQAAHELGIVHRDLKPSNLMLVEGRTPHHEQLKVGDFGIAKIFDPDRRGPEDDVSRSGSPAFTPLYASPEQISGSEVDGRSDIYSIGVILYEMLTGFRPFSGANILYNQLCTPPPPMAQVNPAAEVPPAVERLVLKCLEKKPDDRPQTATDLINLFHQAMATEGVAKADRWMPETPVDRGGLRGGAGVDTLRSSGPHPTVREPAIDDDHDRILEPIWPVRRWILIAAPLLMLAILGSSFAFAPVRRLVFGGGNVATALKLPQGYEAEQGSEMVDGYPAVIVRSSDKARFIRLKGGSFLMGNDADDDPKRKDERPAHKVDLSAFYIQETEVTVEQMQEYFKTKGVEKDRQPELWVRTVEEYRAKLGGKPGHFPAVGIPHDVAEVYAESVGGKLPTEAQWEYAARSCGKKTRYVWGDGPWQEGKAILCATGEFQHVVIAGETDDRTEQNVADLAGNVREWCRDVYGPYTTTPDAIRDPTGPAKTG